MSYGQSYNNAYPAYGEQQNPYANNQGYGQNPYAQDLEMNPVQQQPADPNTLLNEIQKIKEGITQLRALRENRLAAAQNAMLESSSGREDDMARQALSDTQEEIKNVYRKLSDDIARIKKTPGSANVQNQLELQGRAIKKEFEDFQESMLQYRRRLEETVHRRYMTVNKEATPEEAKQAVAEIIAGNMQTFQVTGARTQKANDTRDAVLARSKDIRQIEQTLGELFQLVTELAETVMQQEAAVQQIDQQADNVARDLGNANTQLDSAIVSARKARRWKWYALIIVIIIIAIVVGVAVGVTQANNN